MFFWGGDPLSTEFESVREVFERRPGHQILVFVQSQAKFEFLRFGPSDELEDAFLGGVDAELVGADVADADGGVGEDAVGQRQGALVVDGVVGQVDVLQRMDSRQMRSEDFHRIVRDAIPAQIQQLQRSLQSKF